MSVSKTLALAAATLLIVSVANAAKSTSAKATTAQTVANQGVEKVSAAQTDETTSARPTNSADAASVLNQNSTVPVQKSSASLPDAIKAASPRRVFGEIYAETYHSHADILNKEGAPEVDAYAGVKFDLGNARAVSVRQNFDYEGRSADASRANLVHTQDLAINYTDAKLATILGDGSLTLIGRVYVPTGEMSRYYTGNVGAERLYLIAAKSYGKWDLDVLGMGQVWNNTKDSFFLPKSSGMGPADDKEHANKMAYFTYEFDSLYNFNSKFAAGVSLEVEHLWLRKLAGSAPSQSDFIIEPIIQYTPVKGLAFQAAIVDTMQIEHPKQDLTVGREDELQAFLNVSATL